MVHRRVGGVISTARDLSRWLILQVRADQPGVITPESITMMHTPSDPRSRYGFGWSVSGPAAHRLVSHNGALFTYTAYQVVVPATGYGIAVLANRGYTLGPNDAEAIGRGLLDIAEGRRTSVAIPWWRLVDLGLAVGTLAVIPVGVWWVARTRRQLRIGRRRLALAIPGAVVVAVGLAVLFALPSIGGRISGQRDVTLWQVAHISPAVVTALLLAIALATAVSVVAAASGRRHRRILDHGLPARNRVAREIAPSRQP